MTSMFFGSSDSPLFGTYHSAHAQKGSGILLCPPLFHEYLRTHALYKKIADTLAAHGYPVLRFDYFATGDSSGDSNEGLPKRWIADISVAAHELRDTSGSSEIIIVGLRFGALLAAYATQLLDSVSALLLWDPILQGRDFK